MMADMDGFDALADQVTALEQSLEGAQAMAAAFDAELQRMKDSMVFTGREVASLSSSMGRGLRAAFDGLIFDGLKLSDALRGLAQTMVNSVYSIAMRPIQNAMGGAIANGLNGLLSGMFPFENGGAFAQGRVMPFAKGGGGVLTRHVPDEERQGADGRGGSRGDHAARAGRGRQIGRAGLRWRAADQRSDEHHHTRCPGLRAKPEPDRGTG